MVGGRPDTAETVFTGNRSDLDGISKSKQKYKIWPVPTHIIKQWNHRKTTHLHLNWT